MGKGYIWLLSMMVMPSLAYLQLDTAGQTTNVFFGPSAAYIFNFSLDPTPYILVKAQNPIQSSSMKEEAGTFYDQIYVNKKYWISPYNLGDKNILTFGWYSQFYAGITYSGLRVLPKFDKKRLIGDGIKALYTDQIVLSTVLQFPNNTQVLVEMRIDHLSPYLFLPPHFPWPDRTSNECYRFPDFGNNQICTQETVDGSIFSVQQHQKPYVAIGLHASAVPLALTLDSTHGLRVWGAYRESIRYGAMNLTLIIVDIVLLLAWCLYYCDDPPTRLFSLTVVVAVGLTIAAQIHSEHLMARIQFLSDVNLQLYCAFLVSILHLVALTTLYLPWSERAVDSIATPYAFCVETLLAAALTSLFVGRSALSEELLACVILAMTWTLFESFRVIMQPIARSERLVMAALLVTLYPFVVAVMTAPLMREIPDIESYSVHASHVTLLTPVMFMLMFSTTY